MKHNLTVIILTKNEENAIIDCLESVVFAEEIIIIDDNSTDHTVDLVRNFSHPRIRLFVRGLDNDFSQQRNFGLKEASNDWIFFVDADEKVSLSLQEEIVQIVNSPNLNINGYKLKRIDNMWGTKLLHGENGTIKLVRLGRKDRGQWVGFIHEEWNIKGKIPELKTPLDHFPHQSMTEFLKEINYYTDIRAKELYKSSVKSNVFSIILYPIAKFTNNYFIKHGYRDGVAGLLVAMLMSFHSYLVRSKLWLMIKTNE